MKLVGGKTKTIMNPKSRQLCFSLIIGLGLFLGSIITISSKISHLAYANGAIRYVAPALSGSDDNNDCLDPMTPCATVQRAVDQAATDDEIRVAGGTYTDIFTRNGLSSVVTQVVYISKSLAIYGGYTTTNWTTADFEQNLTILDGQGMGRVVNMEAPDISTPISVTIEGLKLLNGNAGGQASPAGPEGGGGIHGFGITATLRHNTIAQNNGSQSGGGILLVGNGPLTLVDNTIVSNSLETAGNHALGGGIALAISPGSGMDVTLTGNVIRNNTAKENDPTREAKGGGLYILSDDNVSLTDNLIQANQAILAGGGVGQGGGGGIYLDGSQATMINTVIVDNQITGQGFGAGIFALGGNVKLLHTTAARNSGGDGSAINVQAGSVALTNTILVSHTYGITVSTGSTATLNGVLWFDNSSSNFAGAGTINISNEYTGNPAFAADGYHVRSNSAAIDKGVSAGVATDIDGQTRDTVQPDLGADEFHYLSFYLPIIMHTS